MNKTLFFQILLVAVGNFVLAKLGWMFATTPLGASPIWPAVGFVHAMFFFFGIRCWPGIVLGLFPAMLLNHAPIVVAFQNTLGAVLRTAIPYLLIQRFGSFDKTLCESRSYYYYFIFMGLLAAVIGATFGVSSFWMWTGMPISQAVAAWPQWFIGDLLGSMTIGVGLLVWFGRGMPPRPKMIETIKLLLFISISIFLSKIIFYDITDIAGTHLPHLYITFTILIWAAVSYGQRGSSAIVLLFSSFAIHATMLNIGPFTFSNRSVDLFFLQLFMGTLCLTGGSLAAFVEERNRLISSRDDFIAIAAHELRTPLTALQLQLQILHRNLPKMDLTQSQSFSRLLQISQDQLMQFSSLVEDLLDVSRAKSGKLTLKRSYVNLTDLIHNVVNKYQSEIAESKCELIFNLAPVTGFWDEIRLQQIIGNLIANALKFGVGKPIEISSRIEGASAFITIKDQGIGIAKFDQVRVFKRFERAVSVKNFSGIGLGLYITNQLIAAHGGTIRVESHLGRGAAFIVKLPLDLPEANNNG